MIKLAIFDFDGTLCVTHEAIMACLGHIIEKYGFPKPTTDEVMDTIRQGIGLSETLDTLLPDGHDADVDDMVLAYREHYNGGLAARMTRAFDGAVECLRALTEGGVRIAVMSNKGIVAVRDAIQRLGFTRHVDLVIGEARGVAKKPDPATYHRLIRPAFRGIEADETIMIGDTAADIMYAHNIEATACWARYGYGDQGVCSSLAPDLIVDDFDQLATAILGSNATGT